MCKLLDWFKLGSVKPPEAPTIKGTISAQTIRSLYASIFPKDTDKIYLSDTVYEITAISEIRRFVDWDDTNIFAYIDQIHDCDDFALSLAGDFAKYPAWSGFPATFAWGDFKGGHAFFTCIAWPSFEDRTPSVFYIEPQNDWEIAQESMAGTRLWLLPV